jgi:valyl-tRNA synthetase
MLPFATEEAWSWWRDGSVHGAPWPATGDLVGGAAPDLDAVSEVLARVRRSKTEAKTSQRAPVAALTVTAPDTARLDLAADDLVDALTVTRLELRPAVAPDDLDVAVELG